ncbi:alginate O-acetyltransferase [Alcanivorax profundi]|uniref:Alginate O-acetyltransferase n=1 Tax=Alcanivorax profundi TaxID=2338368 RepID=A0A418XTR3_9GAMM|nr:alginate O-acetyltransferase [Alcanivorax profundi]
MISMKKASTVNGWLFLVVISSGFLSLLLPVADFFINEKTAWEQFREGELVRRLERQVDKVFILRDPSISMWADASYVLFHSGRPGVLVGNDDWLFSREEFYYDARSAANLKSNLNQVVATSCQLRALGKKLLVIPVPAKRRLYSDQARRQVVLDMDNLYPGITQRLSAAGIPWLDTLSVLQQASHHGPVFMRTDTHWSPWGARAVAGGVAAIMALPGRQEFRTVESKVEVFQGDLLRYLPTSKGVGPKGDEPLVRYQTSLSSSVQDEQALLGDAIPAVALVGTSYSAMDEWHFPGFLKEEMGQDVLVYALEAQGPFAAMREFLQGPAARDPRVTHVLWELPERALIQSMDVIVEGDKHACLDSQSAATLEFAGLGRPGRR